MVMAAHLGISARKERRGSAASVSGFVPGGSGGVTSGGGGPLHKRSVNNLLSPSSAFPQRERRRNSYAEGVVPALYVQPEHSAEEDNDMTPTLTATQHNGHIMTQQQYASQHLLDPSAAYHRRRHLPPTPLDLANGRLAGEVLAGSEAMPSPAVGAVPTLSPIDGTSTTAIVRRSSSPRVLPTPPPLLMQQQLNSPLPLSGTTDRPPAILMADTSPTPWGSGVSPPRSPFERRASSRRRQLPPEPVQMMASPAEAALPPAGPSLQRAHPTANALAAPVQPLHRSSSMRSAKNGRPAQLPPCPRQQQSLETGDTPTGPPAVPSSSTPCAVIKLPRAASTDQQQEPPSGRAAIIKRRVSAAVASQQSPAAGVDEAAAPGAAESTAPAVNSNCSLSAPPQPVPQHAASAPASPRDPNSAADQLEPPHKGEACSPARKYSSDSPSVMSDLAAISALNLKRNGSGSMAHLLEQQHILRREFTTTPNSDAVSGGGQHSTSSSLSPSIEQLNYNASRSGSDAEIVADPSVLGFDPSLYTNGPGFCGGVSASFSGPSGQCPAEASTSADGAEHPRPRGLGLIHVTLQHFPVRKRLRVNVLKIEGLAGELRPELEIQPFCKLSLTPGKKQQQSSVVKRGRDVVFNQEFFFDGVPTEEIDTKHLQVEVCHSSAQKLQKDIEIGEVRIPLRDLTQQLKSKKELRIVEELKLFSAAKKLGKLHISTCIEKEARRLTINLKKADDLPKWGIIGAPDVQIRIRMQQGTGPEVVKSSRVLKSTTTAVYNEAVMFLISTREADLIRTKITISVHDLSRSVTGNDVIGSVYLGELASDKSEQEQWRNTVDHWGKEYKGVHALKGPLGQGAPDVHVLDVQDEEGDSAD